ncbi:MAG: hypothetical protein ACRD0J_14980 [Acidimicrobiales bacterium]
MFSLCHYLTRPGDRPDCRGVAEVVYGTVALCDSCEARRSMVGEGVVPAPLPDLAALCEVLVANDACARAEATLHDAVVKAHRAAQPWSAIGAVLDISPRAARRRFAGVVDQGGDPQPSSQPSRQIS